MVYTVSVGFCWAPLLLFIISFQPVDSDEPNPITLQGATGIAGFNSVGGASPLGVLNNVYRNQIGYRAFASNKPKGRVYGLKVPKERVIHYVRPQIRYVRYPVVYRQIVRHYYVLPPPPLKLYFTRWYKPEEKQYDFAGADVVGSTMNFDQDASSRSLALGQQDGAALSLGASFDGQAQSQFSTASGSLSSPGAFAAGRAAISSNMGASTNNNQVFESSQSSQLFSQGFLSSPGVPASGQSMFPNRDVSPQVQSSFGAV